MAGLPGSSQKIQKAAFIKPIIENDDFNLMVLDKQKKSNDEYGANFFTNNLLGCEFISSERDNTRTLVTMAERFTRVNIVEDAGEAERIRTTIRRKLKQEDSINIEDLSEELFKDDSEAKENFKSCMSKSGLNENVIVDKTWVDKKLKRTRLKVDKDIDIYINDDAYNDFSKFEIKRNGDGSINIVIKNVINYIEK